MNWIKKLDVRTAVFLNIIVLTLVIIGHLLVIVKVIPFTWVNGGRSTTYLIGKQISMNSIPILIIMILINLWAYNIIITKKFSIILKTLLWLLFAYFIFGTAQQLLGTIFEKTCMSILCIISTIMYFRLAIEKYQ